MKELLKNTNAYKVIKNDKLGGKLSHAYLFECADSESLRSYLKGFAKLLLCEEQDYCDNCRICRLIDKETHPDVSVYPPVGGKLNAKTCDDIVEQSVVKPLELQNRVFIIDGFEKLEKSQNKLLKTLEEPPDGVFLLLGAVNPSAVLPTVKSRVKKLDIAPFSPDVLFDYFKDRLTDEDKLKTAIAISGGKLSQVEQIYADSEVMTAKRLAEQTLKKLNSSRDVLSVGQTLKNVDADQFLSMLKMEIFELIQIKSSSITRLNANNDKVKLAEKFEVGALCEIVAIISELERDLHFNANRQMVIDKILFSVLEAKYRWQKL